MVVSKFGFSWGFQGSIFRAYICHVSFRGGYVPLKFNSEGKPLKNDAWKTTIISFWDGNIPWVFLDDTAPKFNMESKIDRVQKESQFPGADFPLPC